MHAAVEQEACYVTVSAMLSVIFKTKTEKLYIQIAQLSNCKQLKTLNVSTIVTVAHLITSYIHDDCVAQDDVSWNLEEMKTNC